jgi:small subunit ribosomal protein S22
MSAKSLNPGQIFIRQDVRLILQRLTGFDLSKIFHSSYNPKLRDSQIKLLTQQQLAKEKDKANRLARHLLQMPPYLQPRQREHVLLSKADDQRLDPLNLRQVNYMFVDISMNLPKDKRMCVVREPNGILRKADFNEREKLLQVYFPVEGKSAYVPKMFEPLNMEECLKDFKYKLLLDKACLLYEPNDPQFIRITHRCYEHINEHAHHDRLHSTRFFGPMVFYLIWHKKFDGLVAYLLRASRLSDCLDVIRLVLLVHPTGYLLRDESKSDLEMVKMFIEQELNNSQIASQALLQFTQSNEQTKAL